MKKISAICLCTLALFSGCSSQPQINFDPNKSLQQAQKLPKKIVLKDIPQSVGDNALKSRIIYLITHNTSFQHYANTFYFGRKQFKRKNGYTYRAKFYCDENKRTYGYNGYVFDFAVYNHTLFINNNSVCGVCLNAHETIHLNNTTLKKADIQTQFPKNTPVCDYTEPHVQQLISYLQHLNDDLKAYYNKQTSLTQEFDNLAQKYPQVAYINNTYKREIYSKFPAYKAHDIPKLLQIIDQDIQQGIELSLIPFQERMKDKLYYMQKQSYEKKFGSFYIDQYKNKTSVPYVQYKIAQYYEQKHQYQKALHYYELAQQNGYATQKDQARMKEKIKYSFYYQCHNPKQDTSTLVSCQAQAKGMGLAFGNKVLEQTLQNNTQLTRKQALEQCKKYIYMFKVEQTPFGGSALAQCLRKVGF